MRLLGDFLVADLMNLLSERDSMQVCGLKRRDRMRVCRYAIHRVVQKLFGTGYTVKDVLGWAREVLESQQHTSSFVDKPAPSMRPH